MMINNTITKKLLENIVHETFSKFGSISSSSLLDSLKFLGFSYATSAGISINIEDLKTPDLKKNYINDANNEITKVSKNWVQGLVSDSERFQTIIDSWNFAAESLKNRIIEYYQNYDPTNNLYIMAFSGARGNMSQVRQLVGMRGLMSDQDGKIIDLPIQANFREGLSSIDYIISSYGARKGIVDTALKTADSGYLTRRLIYLAQDLVIREKNCQTKNGILLFLQKKSKVQNLIGRYLISADFIGVLGEEEKSQKNELLSKFQEKLLTPTDLDLLKAHSPLRLNLRSSLTCKLNGSICQSCYGWDLAQNKVIALGEAVGIVAAQSIGEPGTQLTMRTFHTGGIFTSELLNQVIAPFSGKLKFPDLMKTIPYRTSHGLLVLKVQQETYIQLIDWKGKKKEIFLDIGSFLYATSSSFVKKGQLIAEFMNQSVLPSGQKLKPIFASISGEIRFENLLVRKIFRQKPTLKVNEDDGVLWISSGKIFQLPKEASFLGKNFLTEFKPFFELNISFPYQGILSFSENKLILLGKEKEFSFSLNDLKLTIKNCFSKLYLFLKNYQYIDKYTLLGRFYIFPKYTGKIYLIRRKKANYYSTFFVITDDDTWKISSDQVNHFSSFLKKKIIIRSGTKINPTLKMKNSGFFLKKDGFKLLFQKAVPIFLRRGTILNYKQGDFILQKRVIANLVNYTQQTEDIVQGLPKIEELIEARKPKLKAYLSARPGILMSPIYLEETKLHYVRRFLKKNIIHCVYTGINSIVIPSGCGTKKIEKKYIYITHSLFLKKGFIVFQHKIYKPFSLPSTFKPKRKVTSKAAIRRKDYLFQNAQAEILLINGKAAFSFWNLIDSSISESTAYQYTKMKLTKAFTFSEDSSLFKNRRGDLIVLTKESGFVFLEYLNPILEYKVPLSSKLLFEPGNFVDLGEPFTEGIIDIHELLHLFFNYHSTLDGILEGSIKALQKFQLLLVHSIQAVYQSQGVNISSKHIEIIVRQMTGKVMIKESGDTPLLPGELIRFSLISQIHNALKVSQTVLTYKTPKFEPFLLSSTNSSLSKDGFLSSAGFQETKRVLAKAAIESSSDWLRGLKESIIVGRILPAGSTFLNYKNYLDNVYLFKN